MFTTLSASTTRGGEHRFTGFLGYRSTPPLLIGSRSGSTPLPPRRERTGTGVARRWPSGSSSKLTSGEPFIAGIDHAFSFPVAYFQRNNLSNWDEFLADFCQHWPTDQDRNKRL